MSLDCMNNLASEAALFVAPQESEQRQMQRFYQSGPMITVQSN